ncbi:hypothetical protein HK405_007008 [Cladochytrium tenue]|nr:hypothetical protein HK405_007008 [Cladochytrium tenue]
MPSALLRAVVTVAAAAAAMLAASSGVVLAQDTTSSTATDLTTTATTSATDSVTTSATDTLSMSSQTTDATTTTTTSGTITSTSSSSGSVVTSCGTAGMQYTADLVACNMTSALSGDALVAAEKCLCAIPTLAQDIQNLVNYCAASIVTSLFPVKTAGPEGVPGICASVGVTLTTITNQPTYTSTSAGHAAFAVSEPFGAFAAAAAAAALTAAAAFFL